MEGVAAVVCIDGIGVGVAEGVGVIRAAVLEGLEAGLEEVLMGKDIYNNKWYVDVCDAMKEKKDVDVCVI